MSQNGVDSVSLPRPEGLPPWLSDRWLLWPYYRHVPHHTISPLPLFSAAACMLAHCWRCQLLSPHALSTRHNRFQSKANTPCQLQLRPAPCIAPPHLDVLLLYQLPDPLLQPPVKGQPALRTTLGRQGEWGGVGRIGIGVAGFWGLGNGKNTLQVRVEG